MRKLLYGFMAAVMAGGPLGALAREPLAAEPAFVQTARRFARQFPQQHLIRRPLDDEMSASVWTNYISALDVDRAFFLAADLDAFRGQISELDDQIKIGDIDFAYRVYEVFMDRVSNRHDFVVGILGQGIDVTTQDTYEWRRKDAPWPATPAEWDDLWRRKIANEYVQQLVAREADAAAATATTNAPINGAGKAPTPEETILKRYHQLLTVLRDNDAEWVFQKYLSAFASAYDPHSAYMSPSSMDDFDIEMKLSLVGIGALLSAEDGAAKVVRIIPGGPADLDKRLQPNDKIIAVADGKAPPVDVLHWPLNKIVKLIRGEKGTRVVLTVIPASDPTASTTRLIDLTRDEVKLEEQAASSRTRTVADSKGVERRLGVIRLPAFYANMRGGELGDDDFRSAAYDVANILEEFRGQGIEGLVLDLRNNGGGSLLEAVKMVGLFITVGPTVQVKERYAVRVLPDMDPTVYYDGPLVVLVNRLSASASEIVAGALQDYRRAIIIGDTKTHGKGSVQTILELGRDSRLGAIKVTTASYYRISGGSTQMRGILSDIILHSPFDFMEFGEEHLPNAMPWSTVPAANYTPFTDLAPVIADLREQSEARRAVDPRFETYDRLLDRVKAIQQTVALPLNLEERRKLARSEEEISKLEAEFDGADTGADNPDDGTERPDLILDESLRILADYVPLSQAARPPPPLPAPPRDKTLGDTILEWFRERL